ncbi:hypothetical protein E4T49_03895 [Aureobasidium sp. EXF-10728]|nr:hypothetical protein E4T49_03895 [Aureobasidium sp. EXF-10728]
MALFALCCTADIPVDVYNLEYWRSSQDQRINNFLGQTYRNSSRMDCQPSLLLLSSLDHPSTPDQPNATKPPTSSFTSPFVNKPLDDVAKLVQSVSATDFTHPTLFAVLDEKSLDEDSGLIVQFKDDVVNCVRVHFDTINTELIRINVITGDIAETKAMIGEDEVFRTKSEQSMKGGPAARKKLGSS